MEGRVDATAKAGVPMSSSVAITVVTDTGAVVFSGTVKERSRSIS